MEKILETEKPFRLPAPPTQLQEVGDTEVIVLYLYWFLPDEV